MYSNVSHQMNNVQSLSLPWCHAPCSDGVSFDAIYFLLNAFLSVLFFTNNFVFPVFIFIRFHRLWFSMCCFWCAYAIHLGPFRHNVQSHFAFGLQFFFVCAGALAFSIWFGEWPNCSAASEIIIKRNNTTLVTTTQAVKASVRECLEINKYKK